MPTKTNELKRLSNPTGKWFFSSSSLQWIIFFLLTDDILRKNMYLSKHAKVQDKSLGGWTLSLSGSLSLNCLFFSPGNPIWANKTLVWREYIGRIERHTFSRAAKHWLFHKVKQKKNSLRTLLSFPFFFSFPTDFQLVLDAKIILTTTSDAGVTNIEEALHPQRHGITLPLNSLNMIFDDYSVAFNQHTKIESNRCDIFSLRDGGIFKHKKCPGIIFWTLMAGGSCRPWSRILTHRGLTLSANKKPVRFFYDYAERL